MLPTKLSRHIYLYIFLCACGFLGNWLRINLFFDVDFLSGSVFSMLAIMVFGRFWGSITALIAGTCTYFIWNHPWAIVIFTGEAIFVSWFYLKKKGNLVLYDLIYWVFVGMPMVYFFYHLVMDMSLQSTLVVMLKQQANGICNSLLASISISLFRFMKRPRTTKTAYSELLFDTMTAFAILPIILLSVFAIRTYQENSMGALKAQVTWVAENARKNMKEWISSHHHNIKVLSTLVGDPNIRPFKEMQHYVELMKGATPEFKGMGVFNDRSVTVSYSPLEQDGKSNLGINLSSRAHIGIMREDKKPLITDMLMSKLGNPSPIVVFLAPIILEGEYRGYCSGVLEISNIYGLLENLRMPGTHITVVDGQNRVIVSTLPDLKTMDPLERDFSAGENIQAATILWQPDPVPNTSVMRRWARSVLFNEAPFSDACRWRVIVEASLLPVAESTSKYCLIWMAFQCLFILVVILISYFLSNGFIISVKKLQVLTRLVPEKLNDTAKIEWPDSSVLELAELSLNCQEMTSALIQQIREQKTAQDALRESLEEKTALLSEVHHRVKNNLQIVSSLLGLQEGRTHNQQAIDILKDTRNRAKSMALLHETLYRSGNLARIDFAAYLKDLCGQMLFSAGVSSARITLEYRLISIEFPLEPALPCGLIVNELVSNALKHGFPGDRKGTITIGLELTCGQTLALSVQDNGVGVPRGFDPSSESTLGMRLVSGLVDQLNGQLRMDTPQHGGTFFTAVFPLPKGIRIGGDL